MRSKRYIQYSPWTKMLVSSSILNLKFQKLGLSWMYPQPKIPKTPVANEGLAWDFSSLKIYITIPGWWETNILGREGGEPKGTFSLGTNISIQYQISFSQGTKYWRWSSISQGWIYHLCYFHGGIQGIQPELHLRQVSFRLACVKLRFPFTSAPVMFRPQA